MDCVDARRVLRARHARHAAPERGRRSGECVERREREWFFETRERQVGEAQVIVGARNNAFDSAPGVVGEVPDPEAASSDVVERRKDIRAPRGNDTSRPRPRDPRVSDPRNGTSPSRFHVRTLVAGRPNSGGLRR